MKILQVHSSDGISHGAGGHIVMKRLHFGLKRAGVDSKILCKNKTPEFSDSIEIKRTESVKILESLLGRVTGRLGLNDIHCISSFGIRRDKAYRDADLVHFHGNHGGFFSYFALPSLTAAKPTVMTLHDMWAYTGHCATSFGCDRWKSGCGNCPYPEALPAIQRDSTRLEWKLKNWVYSRSNLTFVTLSATRTEQAKQSMLKRFPIHRIPNGIDTETYRPLDSEQCRSLLGVPPGSHVLLNASVNLGRFGKGGDLLMKALQGLPDVLKSKTVLLTFGDHSEAIGEIAGIRTLHLGYIAGDPLKVVAYSAADLFLLPTRDDSLPLVLQESMACGTPLVSFRIGGVPDLVRPGITGYLAEPEDPNDFCKGIVQLLQNEALRKDMSQQCREITLKEYSLELQVQRYIELYDQVLRNRLKRTRDA